MHVRAVHTWIPATSVLTVLLLLLEYRLLSFHDALHEKRLVSIVFGGTLVLALAALKAPGIMAALFVLALGYHRGNRVMIGAACAFLAMFLSAYYYTLEITLLAKSYTLLAVGATLLVLRPLLSRALPANVEGGSHE